MEFNPIRKIIHVDMDAFYASVEQRDDPSLVGKPVIVGGQPSGRGVVCTASYEARKFGVHSAQPSREAYRRCPHGIFVRPRFDVYKQASRQIMEVFSEYTDLVEGLSLDEAYLDVTENKKNIPFGIDVAKEIRSEIFLRTGLTASAGVAPNKFLAKLASDMKKPDALVVIPPERIEKVMVGLPVKKLPGVGRVTEERMHQAKLFTADDIRGSSLERLVELFGKTGRWYYEIAHGRDERLVCPYRESKSIGAEDTFEDGSLDIEWIHKKIEELSAKVTNRLRGREGFTVTLKVTYKGFKRITRGRTLPKSQCDPECIALIGKQLLEQTEAGKVPIRLVGISVSNLKKDVGEIPVPILDTNRQMLLPFLGIYPG